MGAIVILPEHLHCIWQLPQEDDNYFVRWRLIKSSFSQSIATNEYISKSRQRKKEKCSLFVFPSLLHKKGKSIFTESEKRD